MLYSAVFKAKARAVLQQHWQTALLIALIVNLPTLLVQGIAAFTDSDPLLRMETMMVNASLNADAMNTLPDDILAMLSETGVVAMTALSVLAWLVTPVLSLGMNHWVLERIRGQENPVSAVFSRLGIFLKGIGLRLLITLKVLVWMLPGLAVAVLATVFTARTDASTRDALLSVLRTGTAFLYFGMLLMLVLGVMGYLRYAVADFILADEPEERVSSCTRRSKQLMAGHAGQFFSLLLSFLFWYLLIILVSGMAASAAGGVMSLMVQMLGSLFLSVYMLTAQGVFYEVLRSAPVPAPQELP